MILKKLSLLFLIFIATPLYADVFTSDTATTNYNLPYWTRGQRNWDDRMNLGTVSIDTILKIMSNDIATGGGGAISPIVSSDIATLNIKVNILSNDAVIQDQKIQILSNDSVTQNTKLTILTNDAVIQDQKIQILSNDTVTQNIRLTILTNDAVIQDNKLTILSNDAVTWRDNRVSRDAALATLTADSICSTGSPAYNGSFFNFNSSQTVNNPTPSMYVNRTQASGGGASSVPIGAIYRTDVTGGTMSHAVGIVGWQYPTASLIAGTYYGVEGRVDIERTSVNAIGVYGLTYLNNGNDSTNIAYAVCGEAATSDAHTTGGTNVGVYGKAVGATANYNGLFGDGSTKGDNGYLTIRGYITDGAGAANINLYVNDTYDAFIIDSTDAKIDYTTVALRDAAGASNFTVLDSNVAAVFNVNSNGLLSADTLSVNGKYALPTTSPTVNGSTISYDSADNSVKWGTLNLEAQLNNRVSKDAVLNTLTTYGAVTLPNFVSKDAVLSTLSVPLNILNEQKHLRFNIINPATTYVKDTQICVVPRTYYALTVVSVDATCDADPTTEPTGDLKYADAFIGLGNATVINQFDTVAGITNDSTMASASVAAGKCIYVQFDVTPDAAITSMAFDITYRY